MRGLRSLKTWRTLFVMVASGLLLTGSAFAQGQSFIRGDCNADGAYDIADPITILGVLFQNMGAPLCEDACDCNDDGSLDIGDAICMLSGLFGMPTIPPAAPFPDCGPDPTEDMLGCAMFLPCPDPPTAVLIADPISGPLPLQVFFDGSDSSSPIGPLASYMWDFGDGSTASGIFVEHTYTAVGMFTATLTVTDTGGLTDTATVMINAAMADDPVTIESSSPTSGETGVAVTRETIINFSAPIDPATVNSSSISASFSGVALPVTIHVNPNDVFIDSVTLFYPGLLPGGSLIDVSLDGDLLLDAIGRQVDVDGDGVAGGQETFSFSTLSLTPVANTAVCGRVFASEYSDAVAGQPINVPLEGVTITIDGVDPGTISAVTDALGSFRLEPVPAGEFFVHVDGRTVTSAMIDGMLTPTSFPDGPYYPFVGKPFESIAAQEVLLPDIFLPLVEAGSLTAVSETEDTEVCMPASVVAENPELAGVCMTVPAGSLFADDGTPGGMVGIAPVDPERLPGPLPPELNPALVITVQTDGATNFNVPAPICLPNLPDPITGVALEPGDEAALLSFNHDIGEWEVVGSMTVSLDGTLVCTDPGSGILAPGWHAVAPVTSIIDGDIIKNLPEDLQKLLHDILGPNFEGNIADALCKHGKAVYLHSGEENLERVDLHIPGRGGIDFVMRRRYRSRLDYNGPLGHGWDFDYNEKFFNEPGGGVSTTSGNGRIDFWAVDPATGNFQSPPGFYRSIQKMDDGSLIHRLPNGFKKFFHPDGRLMAHEDPTGNRMIFEYDGFGMLDTVIDTFGHRIRFFHEEIAGRRRLTRIRDYIGREVRYTYDANGDLRSVRTPTVTGTPTGNNFPNGRTEEYTYSSGFVDPVLNHNLLSVTSPEEVALGGPARITWDYGTDPFDLNTYDKVIAEHVGGGGINASGVPAGGTTTFQYEQLNVFEPLGQPDLPRGKVLVTERNGNQFEYFVNEFDHHIITRWLTQGLRPGEPAFYETRSYFDADGQLVRRVFPEGNEVHYTYESGSRSGQFNLIEMRRIADPARGGGEDLVTTYTYEPIYNRRATITDPRGNATTFTPPIGSASAERYTSRLYYDYQEGTPAQILALAAELEVDLDPDGPGPITALDVAQSLSMNTDLNNDGRTDQQDGNLVRLEESSVTLLPDSLEAARIGSTTQAIVTENRYNDFGQLISQIDAEGNVHQYEFHPWNDPDGDGEFNSTSYLGTFYGGSSQPGGWESREIVDAADSYRRTTTEPPRMLATEFFYDRVGNQTGVRDPRGVLYTTVFNELDEPIQVFRGSDVSVAAANGQLITGENAPGFETRMIYDHNGRVVRREVENRGLTTPGVGNFVESTYTYDLLDNLVEQTHEVDATATLTWQFRYDESELPIATILPEGNRYATSYDERNFIFRETRGEGSPNAATTQTDYDLNGNPIRLIDAEDNNGDSQSEVTQRVLDGFDRVTTLIDALGNEIQTDFDPASNPVAMRVFGHPPGAPNAPNVLLRETLQEYDELGRLYRSGASLFVSNGFTTVRPVSLSDENSDGIVSGRMEYDALSRPTYTWQDDLEVTRNIYDGASRLIESIDAAGNRLETVYDANDNPIQVIETEVATNGIVPDEVFVANHVYDSLNRLVRTTDNAGNTSRSTFDSRDNEILMSDAEGPLIADPFGLFPGPGQSGLINDAGNTVTLVYDGLNREIRKVIDLRVDGLGGNGIDTTNPSNPDGQIVQETDYDGNSRITALRDDNGNPTTYGYDELDREVSKTNADGTIYLYSYDRDDNLITTTDPNGTVITQVHDALHRVTQINVARGTDVLGTTQETYEYDGLSRVTRTTDNNGGTVHTCERVFDSLSRVLEERFNGSPTSAVFAGDGRRLSCTYPSGFELTATHDEIDRLATLSHPTGLVATHEWIGPNSRRELRRSFGNGTVTTALDTTGTVDVGHDAARRPIQRRTLAPGGPANPHLDRLYSYNRVHMITEETRVEDFSLRDSFTYDSAYRIVRSDYDQDGLAGSVPRDLVSEDFRFDGVGNRTLVNEQTQSALVPIPYATNVVNEYTSVDGVIRTHDDNGNLSNDGGVSLFFDYRDRLVEARTAGGDLIAQYEYFSGTRRARKVLYGDSPPNTVIDDRLYTYDQQRCAEEHDGVGGNHLLSYVWGPTYVDDLQQIHRTANHPLGAGVVTLHQDARMNVAAATDEVGDLLERRRFDLYGNPDLPSVTGTEFAFQGRRLDEEVDLYHFRARAYDAKTGRFVQRDTLEDPQTRGNQYSFVGESPLTWVDPMGRQGGQIHGRSRTQAQMNAYRTASLAKTLRAHQAMRQVESTWSYKFNIGGARDQHHVWKTELALACVHLRGADEDYRNWQENEKHVRDPDEAWQRSIDRATFVRDVATGILVDQAVGKLISAKDIVSATLRGDWKSLAMAGGEFFVGKVAGRLLRKTGARKCHECFAEGTSIATAQGSLPIEEVRVGCRVTSTEDPSPDFDLADVIVPSEWRLVTYELVESEAGLPGSGRVTALQPLSWLEAQGIELGSRHSLEIPEFGPKRLARVVAMESCPELEVGPGQLVLATTVLRTHEVLHLTVTGGSTLTITAPHPVFSSSYDAWVPASRIRVGDHLATMAGDVSVLQIERLPGARWVYNFQVAETHSYFAGHARILSHNTCPNSQTRRAQQDDLLEQPGMREVSPPTGRGMQNPKVREAVEVGNQRHAELSERMRDKGWKVDRKDTGVVDPATGRTIYPDAITPSGHPIEIKPNTPTGRAAGASQLEAYERATGKKGRVIYYD